MGPEKVTICYTANNSCSIDDKTGGYRIFDAMTHAANTSAEIASFYQQPYFDALDDQP